MPNADELQTEYLLRALMYKLVDIGVLSWDDYFEIQEDAIAELLDAATRTGDVPELQNEYVRAAATLQRINKAGRNSVRPEN